MYIHVNTSYIHYMSFKPKKFRSIVIKKGQVQKNIKFQIGAEQIPTVNEEPIKCLGKWYDGTLRYTDNSMKLQVEEVTSRGGSYITYKTTWRTFTRQHYQEETKRGVFNTE